MSDMFVHILKRRDFLGISSGLLVGLCSPYRLLAEALGRVLAIRYSSDGTRVRIVIDCNRDQSFTVSEDAGTGAIRVRLPGCSSDVSSLPLADPDIERISLTFDDGATLITITPRSSLKTEVFSLPADTLNDKPNRVVIDLLRSKQSKPAGQSSVSHSQRPPTAEAQSRKDLDSIIDEDIQTLEAKAEREELERLKAESSSSDHLQYGVRKIIIDAGHGGFDAGAVGKSGLREKDVAFAIASFLRDTIKAETDIAAFLTRSDDYFVPLGERTTIANQFRADLFVSVHINAAVDPKAEGIETFHCSETASDAEAARLADYENSVGKDEDFFREEQSFISVERILAQFERRIYWAESSRFAERVQSNMLVFLKRRNRKVRFANFFVLRRAKMPALLAEVGFISNPDEEKLLKTVAYQKDAARAMFTGIMSYVRRT